MLKDSMWAAVYFLVVIFLIFFYGNFNQGKSDDLLTEDQKQEEVKNYKNCLNEETSLYNKELEDFTKSDENNFDNNSDLYREKMNDLVMKFNEIETTCCTKYIIGCLEGISEDR